MKQNKRVKHENLTHAKQIINLFPFNVFFSSRVCYVLTFLNDKHKLHYKIDAKKRVYFDGRHKNQRRKLIKPEMTNWKTENTPTKRKISNGQIVESIWIRDINVNKQQMMRERGGPKKKPITNNDSATSKLRAWMLNTNTSVILTAGDLMSYLISYFNVSFRFIFVFYSYTFLLFSDSLLIFFFSNFTFVSFMIVYRDWFSFLLVVFFLLSL